MKCECMAFSTSALKTTVKMPDALPSYIKPVGIAPVANVGGDVAIKTGGNGTGVFNQLLDLADTAFSTFKGQQPAPSVPGIVDRISETDSTYSNNGTGSQTSPDSGMMNLLLCVLGIIGLAKLFNIKF